ncbi:GyrI-like domain-containing protein [Extibacter muris]|nr:GyrI-like domain-containing protein [Extibacter muris]
MNGENKMKIEEFKNITIAYMRNVGEYGIKNEMLMERFKDYLKANHMLDADTVILGIALDNPAATPPEELRYDVGIIIKDNMDIGLNTRKIDDGTYAIYETAHTKQAVIAFWRDIAKLTEGLAVDYDKPVIERYATDKIAENLCEFCVPLT